jgi:hypothetical protein
VALSMEITMAFANTPRPVVFEKNRTY